jgi:hypothetical protein
MRTALALAIFGLTGCASVFWRPQPISYYSCFNTDVRFGVYYNWDPPIAYVTMDGDVESADLPLLPPAPGQDRDVYRFAGPDDNLRLTVTSRYAYLTRPGERELVCAEEEIIVVTERVRPAPRTSRS